MSKGIPILCTAVWEAESSASVVDELMLPCLLLIALMGKLEFGPRKQQKPQVVQRRVSTQPAKSESEKTIGVKSCKGSPIQPTSRQCFVALM